MTASSQAVSTETELLARELFALLEAIDPSRWRDELEPALRAKVAALVARLKALIARPEIREDPRFIALGKRLTNLNELIEDALPNVEEALRRWGRIETMPPWLDEGMAEDLSLSRVDRKQRLVVAPLGPTNLHYGRRLGVMVLELERKITTLGTAPSLPQLLAMDRKAFLATDNQLNYLMSALWIRYLLSDPESDRAEGFRTFLARAAAGGRTDPEELRSRLGQTWPQLASGFRGWLVLQRARFGL